WFSFPLVLFCTHLATCPSCVDLLGSVTSSGPLLPDLYEASILDLQAGLAVGTFTSVHLVYLARIEEVNINGPGLRAVIETNPSALQQAADLDRERSILGQRSALHGIPIIIKDIIATVASEGMNTTAGSYSLLGSIVPEDAGVVKRLRKAGAIILGKSSLDEFSGARGKLNGWSGRGGQRSSAYFPLGDTCGSSSGSGVAASIGLAVATLGSETDGSITCPSGRNNVAGIKPTVGLTSRAGVIPITAHQDTFGPLARSFSDAAVVLSIIAGKDPNDNYTLTQPDEVPDFTKALNKSALIGKRIGVPRRAFLNETMTKNHPSIGVAFEKALETLKSLGATIIDPADLPSADELVVSRNETNAAIADFKVQLNQYLEALIENPSGVRNLEDLIKFNDAHPELEGPAGYEDQNTLIKAQNTSIDAAYFKAVAFNRELGGTRGIDFALKEHNLHALVLPSDGYTTIPAALVGYPIVTVPLGFLPADVEPEKYSSGTFYPAPGIPFGLSFLGKAFSDFDLISFVFAYEQETRTRLAKKAFPAAIPKTQLKDVM
ncbi:amidase signature domain-containing protein, partial [Mycena rebaudengoi]